MTTVRDATQVTITAIASVAGACLWLRKTHEMAVATLSAVALSSSLAKWEPKRFNHQASAIVLSVAGAGLGGLGLLLLREGFNAICYDFLRWRELKDLFLGLQLSSLAVGVVLPVAAPFLRVGFGLLFDSGRAAMEREVMGGRFNAIKDYYFGPQGADDKLLRYHLNRAADDPAAYEEFLTPKIFSSFSLDQLEDVLLHIPEAQLSVDQAQRLLAQGGTGHLWDQLIAKRQERQEAIKAFEQDDFDPTEENALALKEEIESLTTASRLVRKIGERIGEPLPESVGAFDDWVGQSDPLAQLNRLILQVELTDERLRMERLLISYYYCDYENGIWREVFGVEAPDQFSTKVIETLSQAGIDTFAELQEACALRGVEIRVRENYDRDHFNQFYDALRERLGSAAARLFSGRAEWSERLGPVGHQIYSRLAQVGYISLYGAAAYANFTLGPITTVAGVALGLFELYMNGRAYSSTQILKTMSTIDVNYALVLGAPLVLDGTLLEMLGTRDVVGRGAAFARRDVGAQGRVVCAEMALFWLYHLVNSATPGLGFANILLGRTLLHAGHETYRAFRPPTE